tara:strand:- start:10086 stop:10940 length:855 start_codon:yes stop_codon:yes gene_type:complete
MIISSNHYVNLEATLFSGQCFRWISDPPWFYGVISNNLIKIREHPKGIEFFSTPTSETLLKDKIAEYFNLDENLDDIYSCINSDSRINTSIHLFQGMRILTQDPWECLISFICSSASNIKKIRRNIDSLTQYFGNKLYLDQQILNTFPTIQNIVEIDEDILRNLGLGYRSKYIKSTAQTILNQKIKIRTWENLNYQEGLDQLVYFKGIGDKIANCILLFSLNKKEAFPVDRWIEQILRNYYLTKSENKSLKTTESLRLWGMNHFGKYAGYANHYLFHYFRTQNK